MVGATLKTLEDQGKMKSQRAPPELHKLFPSIYPTMRMLFVPSPHRWIGAKSCWNHYIVVEIPNNQCKVSHLRSMVLEYLTGPWVASGFDYWYGIVIIISSVSMPRIPWDFHMSWLALKNHKKTWRMSQYVSCDGVRNLCCQVRSTESTGEGKHLLRTM